MRGHVVGKIQYVKMSLHHKLIYIFNKILINVPIGFLPELEENMKFSWKNKWARSTILLNKNIKHSTEETSEQTTPEEKRKEKVIKKTMNSEKTKQKTQ